MKPKQKIRILIVMLLVICLLGQTVSIAAEPEQSDGVTFTQVANQAVTASLNEEHTNTEGLLAEPYADTDMVRVSILMEGNSTIDQGYSTKGIVQNRAAVAYHQQVLEEQASVQRVIERTIGEKLDVQWNIALVSNLISANVEYGQIEKIRQVKGVSAVEIEQYYYPQVMPESDSAQVNMAYSSAMTGVPEVWENGYTGAGMRIAILDTGLDDDHQSFSAEAYEHALKENAAAAQLSYEDYVDRLNLMDAEEIETLLSKLNASQRGGTNPEKLYLNSKVPFAFGYATGSYDANHDNDTAGNHGSHVAGIAAANRYIKKNGEMVDAMEQVMTAGNAPDAQILVLDVFGNQGAAYSDILAAFEDAIWLGADTINLSLGSASPGHSNGGFGLETLLETIKNTDSVATISAGNNYEWSHFSKPEALYASDVNTYTGGAPGSATNALTIASVQNSGSVTSGTLSVDNQLVEYSENFSYASDHKNTPLAWLDTSAGGGTELEYIVFEHYSETDSYVGYEELVKDKVVLCSRGGSSVFAEKGNHAMAAGAKAVIIYNNVSGMINMDLTGFNYEAPCVFISKDSSELFKEAGTKTTDSNGTTYYTGTLKVSRDNPGGSTSTTYKMSDFSSWGVTGDLALKPELTAPGGNIYSVDGGSAETDKYTTMSGTSMSAPQVAGIGALVMEHIQKMNYSGSFANPTRGLTQSLLMSTATPMKDDEGCYYPVIQQGAGLVNVVAATSADTYIKMKQDATVSYDDGKVKAELGDDPARTGKYTFGFELHNLSNEEKTFALSADVFAQDSYLHLSRWDGGVVPETMFMDIQTRLLNPASVQFAVNGATVKSVSLTGKGAVTVQATIELSKEDKKYLDDSFQFGTYVQAYVFAKEQSNTEGVAGIVHSIPVLAFYGNWTDPTMFYGASSRDGQFYSSYSTEATTDNSRFNYFEWSNTGTGEVFIPYNHIELTDAEGTYTLGGNPLLTDKTYKPERNALKSGIQEIYAQMWLARNATQLVLEMTGDQTTYAFTKSRGEYTGAYKNTVGAGNGRVELRLTPETQPEDGDRITFIMQALPEYYDDGKMGEDSTPGTGATASITAVVDNTSPTVDQMKLDPTNRLLKITATDNRYVAGIVMYNGSGDQVVTYAGAKETIGEGETAVYELDIRGIQDTEFLVQVFDYAMNAATFRVKIAFDELSISGAMLAFNQTNANWVMLEKHVATLKDMTTADGKMTYQAASAVGDVIYAVSQEGNLYTIPVADLNTAVFVRSLGHNVTDLAYNRADGYLYGVTDQNQMVRIDTITGVCELLGFLPLATNTLACDGNGMFYSNKYGTGEVYAYTLDTLRKTDTSDYDFNGDGSLNVLDSQYLLDYVVGSRTTLANEVQADLDEDDDVDTYDVYLLQKILGVSPTLVATATDVESTYLQAMEIDPNNGILYWASYFVGHILGEQVGFSALYEIDPANGSLQRHYDYGDQLSALVILDKNVSRQFPPINGITRVNLSETSAALSMGEQIEIQAGVSPWNTDLDRTLIWSSSDESVATVDAQGVVTAISNGTCVITATSASTPDVSAACTVVIGEPPAEEDTKPVAEVCAVSAGLVNNSLKAAYLAAQDGMTTVEVPLISTAEVTNGLQKVHFDADRMVVLSVTGDGLTGYHTDGDVVTVGYVPSAVSTAGETVATLTFRVTGSEMDADLIIRELQRNNEHVDLEAADNLDGHIWSTWNVSTPATCGVDGLESRTCSHCDETENRVIPATGEHDWSEWRVTEAASTEKKGVRTRSCSTCKKSETGEIHAVGAAHAWGSWMVTTEATCGIAGVETRICEDYCGIAPQTRAVAATGTHQWGAWQPVEGTNTRTRSCGQCPQTQTKVITQAPEGTLQNSDFGRLYIDQHYVHDVQIYGAAVNAITQVEAQALGGQEQARLHYVVELSKYANDVDRVQLKFSVWEQWVTGIGSALKSQIVESVRGDWDDLVYDVDISTGTGYMECYSYWDGTSYATIMMEFIIGEDGEPYQEPYEYYEHDGYVNGLAVWGAEVDKETTYLSDPDNVGDYDYTSTVISRIWLDPDTTPDDAMVGIQFQHGGDATELPKGWNDNGGYVQLENGKATVSVVRTHPTGNSNLRRTYIFYLDTHYTSTAPELLRGSEVALNAEIGVPFALDLNDYFMDFDGDVLSYTVSVNGAAATALGSGVSMYSYIPMTNAVRVLTVTGSDPFGESKVCTFTITPVEGHSWSEWTVSQAATCVKDGTEQRACQVCGETETKTIACVGSHSWLDWQITKDAAGNEAGKEIRRCEACGEVEIRAVQAFVYGDVDGDGKIMLSDVVTLVRYLARWDVTMDENAADANADGSINLQDAILLRRYLTHWDVVLGPSA